MVCGEKSLFEAVWRDGVKKIIFERGPEPGWLSLPGASVQGASPRKPAQQDSILVVDPVFLPSQVAVALPDSHSSFMSRNHERKLCRDAVVVRGIAEELG